METQHTSSCRCTGLHIHAACFKMYSYLVVVMWYIKHCAHKHTLTYLSTHTHTLSLRSCGLVCVSNNLSVPRSRGNQLECEIENKQSFQIVKPLRQPASPSLFEAHRLSSDHIQIYSIAHVP